MNINRKVKKTQLNFLPEIPFNWDLKKLKFLVNIYNGDSLNDDLKVLFESDNVDDIPYIASKNIDLKTSVINYNNGTRIPKASGKFKIAPKNSTLLCIEGGSAGRKIAYVDRDVCFVNKLACFHSKDEITSKYIYYSLRSNLFLEQFKNSLTGMIGGVSISNLKNFFLAIPSHAEQKLIVNYLDKQIGSIDMLIDKKNNLIRLLKEKRLAIIAESVTKGLNPNIEFKETNIHWIGKIPNHWNIKRTKFIFGIKKEIAGTLGHSVLSVTQKGIKIRDIDDMKGQLSMDYSKYQLVNHGDFIMNHMDLLTGFVDISKYEGVTSPDYRVFSALDEQISNQFYLYIFQLCYLNKIFFGLGQGVSQLGRWRMPASSFNNFFLPFPPYTEQKEIANHIDRKALRINSIIESEEIIINKLTEYKKSLISEVVTGKLKIS